MRRSSRFAAGLLACAALAPMGGALAEGGDPILLFEDLEFGEAGDTIDLTPGSYRLAVDVNNDDIFDVFDWPTAAGSYQISVTLSRAEFVDDTGQRLQHHAPIVLSSVIER